MHEATLTSLCDHQEVGHILQGRGVADVHGGGRAVALHAGQTPVGGHTDDRNGPHWAHQGVALQDRITEAVESYSQQSPRGTPGRCPAGQEYTGRSIARTDCPHWAHQGVALQERCAQAVGS